MNVSPAIGGDINVAGQGIPSTYPKTWTCSTSYTLTAVPNSSANYKFNRWGGAASGTTNPITISAGSVTAYFVLKTEPVSIQEVNSLLDGT